MIDCTVRVEAGAAIDPHLVEGAVVCLAPGVHAANLLIEASLTLRGEPGAVIDAGRAGPVLRVAGDQLVVKVEGLTLRGGAGDAGGGVRLTGWSELWLSNCRLEDNEALLGGGGIGGGAFAERGKLTLSDCAFSGNRARNGNDLMANGLASVEVNGGSFAGDVVLVDGVRATLSGARVHGRLTTRGTTTRAPSVTLRGTAVDGGIDNDANLPATLVVEDG
ncbi:MAG: hypothetical protein FJ090_09045 [Deltaproteobacteria bacterium]|nr:hypothetical protein [Deltaproteobacteria bacterium]